jgi:hypothetical protein
MDFILNAADCSGIEYYRLDSAREIKLRQYVGTVDSATLDEEKPFRFETGAYLFPMNQYSGNALAMLMEPDVYRTGDYAISLAQGGKLAVGDIFRCEQTLTDIL